MTMTLRDGEAVVNEVNDAIKTSWGCGRNIQCDVASNVDASHGSLKIDFFCVPGMVNILTLLKEPT